MAERFRLADDEFFGDGDQALVYRRGSSQPTRLPVPIARLLSSCRTYKTLEEHAASWCRAQDMSALRQLGSSQRRGLLSKLARKAQGYVERDLDDVKVDPKKLSATKQQLESLLNAGFLNAESGFIEACAGATDSNAPDPIATVGLTTANRPAELERALRSYIENSREFGRTCGFAIIDDSGSTESEGQSRALASALSREYSATLSVTGRAERESFVTALAKESGVDRPVVEFAVLGDERCPITTGSARNTLLLETVGSSYLLVDDDSVCRMARTPDAQPGLSFSSVRDPTSFWFFANRDETIARAPFEDVDFLGVHERMLGRDIGGLCGGQLLNLDDAMPSFEARLRDHAGRVRMSMAGILGDSGIGSSAYVTVNEQSRERLVTSEEAYLAAVESRQVLRAVSTMTVSEGTHCMAGNLGIDNRKLLPPFIPVQRNSDGKFAMLLRACFPDAYSGHLPYAGLHDPVAARSHSYKQWLEDVRRVRFTDLVTYSLAMAPERAAWLPPEAALQRLGAHLSDLAQAPTAEFFEQFRLHLWKTRAERPKPDDSGCPEFYARRRQEFRETLAEAVVSPRYFVPRDLNGGGSEDEVRELTRELIGKIGKVIEAWPAIIAAANVVAKSRGKAHGAGA